MPYSHNKKPSTPNSLMKHLRLNGVAISGSAQKRSLRNMGYYHGYKGYRFVGNSHNRLDTTDFKQIATIYNFDTQLKTLLYPCVMQIETALKNRTLEAVLANSNSAYFEDIWKRSLTAYRDAPSRSKYGKAWEERQRLRGEIDSLIYRNSKDRDVIAHFKEKDAEIPIWALFEVMTLGNFGTFYKCLGNDVKSAIVTDLGMPTNLDSAHILESMIFALKDLRNAIAHNGVIHDVRFQKAKTYQKVGTLFSTTMHVKSVDFTSLTDYVVMLTYLMKQLGFTKTECRQLVDSYEKTVKRFEAEVPTNIFTKVVHPKTGYKLQLTKKYLRDK